MGLRLRLPGEPRARNYFSSCPNGQGAERWPSGRRHQIANLAYWVTGTEGSNPSLSAIESAQPEILRGKAELSPNPADISG
jgi:hypothetical protein